MNSTDYSTGESQPDIVLYLLPVLNDVETHLDNCDDLTKGLIDLLDSLQNK